MGKCDGQIVGQAMLLGHMLYNISVHRRHNLHRTVPLLCIIGADARAHPGNYAAASGNCVRRPPESVLITLAAWAIDAGKGRGHVLTGAGGWVFFGARARFAAEPAVGR